MELRCSDADMGTAGSGVGGSARAHEAKGSSAGRSTTRSFSTIRSSAITVHPRKRSARASCTMIRPSCACVSVRAQMFSRARVEYLHDVITFQRCARKASLVKHCPVVIDSHHWVDIRAKGAGEQARYRSLAAGGCSTRSTGCHPAAIAHLRLALITRTRQRLKGLGTRIRPATDVGPGPHFSGHVGDAQWGSSYLKSSTNQNTPGEGLGKRISVVTAN